MQNVETYIPAKHIAGSLYARPADGPFDRTYGGRPCRILVFNRYLQKAKIQYQSGAVAIVWLNSIGYPGNNGGTRIPANQMPEKVELNTDIGAFLPTKLANFLRISQFEISELHQLLERTEQELRTVPSVKEKSVSLIKETLAKYGYTLK